MQAMVKTLWGHETTGCVDPTEINFRRDILTRLSSVNGLVWKRVGIPCNKEGKKEKERERERERENITNDTTQRYVDDLVRKCVEVKTSRGRCTTGFDDLVEINFFPLPRVSSNPNVGVAGTPVDLAYGGGKFRYSKYLVMHEG